MRTIRICILLVLVFFTTSVLTSSPLALSYEAVVGGGSVLLGQEKNISIPITITNNPGLMGFKISVDYSSDVVSLESVEQGSITKTGSFSTKTDSKNKVTILWNNTYQVSEDGTLFVLNFAVLDHTKNGTVVFSLSEEDTFNEEYENVSILFGAIDLIASNDSEGPITEMHSETDTNRSEQDPEKNPTPSVQKTEQEARISAAVAEIKNNFTDSEIESIISNSLKEIDSSSIKTIPSGMIEAFAEDIREQLAIDSVEKINELTDDELLSALVEVYENVSHGISEEQDGHDKLDDKQKYALITVIAIASLTLVAIVVAITKKNKNSAHNKEEKR